MRGRSALYLFVSLLAAIPARASFVDDRSLNDMQRYNRCLALVRSDADEAYEEALAWQDAGGGAAATHCSALALVQSKHYAQAAFKLDGLARSNESGDASLRAQLLDQAGNAWLLAGQPENAKSSFSAAMNLGAEGADVLADRARAEATLKDWNGAVSDLSKAIQKDEYRADLLVLRGSALHALNRRREARADFEAALQIDPHYSEALVERGAMKLEDGDRKGARADWQLVLVTQPNSPAADTARARIEQLELNEKGPSKPTATRH